MIKREAVQHIPLSQYAFANGEFNVTFRLRAGKGNVDDCMFNYGDRVQAGDPIVFTPLKMKKIAYDQEFDYFEITFSTPYNRICYYFLLEDEEEKLFYVADIFLAELPLERSEFFQYPFIRREEISTVPDWLKRAIVYNIFPDSFANKKRGIVPQMEEREWENGLKLKSRLGGTIKGITENLDYIADLGFNCIYLNPFFTAGEYHKYDILDYFHVSPNMGSDEDFAELVKLAHELGIRVVIDGVFNHCSWYFFAFDDVVKKGRESAYVDWFYQLEFPVRRPSREDEKPLYSCFAYERKMPKLNSSNPEVRNYFIDVCTYWIKKFHVDGWRLDVANEIDRDFWREFRKAAKAANPNAVMIGEIWESAETWLRGDMFDSTMNYDFRRYCRDFFGQSKINAAEFNARITKMNLRYPTGILQGQLNLLDSHDVNRFISFCQGDIRRFRLAELFLFMMPGAPCIFYGDELGMSGCHEFELRGPMAWSTPPQDEREFFKQLIHYRKENKILIYGDFITIMAEEGGLYIFQRNFGVASITVALNVGENEVDIQQYVSKKQPKFSCKFKNGCLGAFGYAVWDEEG
ncbi:glycoside hydrolase family 13 protein [Clostridiales bacterium COT073_COT-073]|nr:glycoside hydrolase family 13 protein [Clostridiales bacterium COT073_COT-073]